MGNRMNHVLYLDRHGVKLGFEKNRLTVRPPDAEEQTLPIEPIDAVVVLGHTHFSHNAIAALLQRNIPVIFSSLKGGYRGRLTTHLGQQVLRRQRQLDAMRDPEQCLLVAKALVQAKIQGHKRLLRQWKITACADMHTSLHALAHCQNLEPLRGYEGIAARAFFNRLGQHLNGSPFCFEQRQYHPAPDPVNAVLSLAYTLLTHEMEVGVAATGLDVAGGFYHTSSPGRPALLMDLIEPLRPLADRLSVGLLRRTLQPTDFTTSHGVCRLSDGKRGIIYTAWETLLNSTIIWRSERTTWRRLIHLQAREMAQWIDGRITLPRFWHLDGAQHDAFTPSSVPFLP